ncbi:MAG: TonB-dependent receptor [Acidobacteria bacterium]|nr:TonB-dependent receptor [Acidobacteriota bacterium]
MLANRCPRFIAVFSAAFILLLSSASFAQITASIRGTITDPSNAAVPNAHVTATNVDTGFAVETTSSNDGSYTITLLPIGHYRLRIAATGFETQEQAGITLTTNQVAGINTTLKIGNVSQTVSVTGGLPIINTQTSEVGQLINSEQARELPLNGRNPIQLATLVNGVSGAQVVTVIVGADERNSNYMSVNGNRQYMTEYYLDGGEYRGPKMNSGLVYPNPDSLEQFRFITNNYSAEFGKNPGGLMNVVTKSGTNTLHGDLWEFNRNSAFAARNYFLNSVAPLNQNQFGFTVGGPFKKEKLFFFGSGEWLRIRQGVATSSVFPPTAAQRTGDFSAITTPIKNPLTGTPFPGNIIPKSQLDPIAVKLVNLLPLGNTPSGLFVGAFSQPTNTHQYLIKADANLTSRNRLSGSWFQDSLYATSLLDFGRLATPFVNNTGQSYKWEQFDIKSAIANDTFVITPNLLNQFRFGYLGVAWVVSNVGRGPGLRELGSNFPVSNYSDIPHMAVAGIINNSGGNDTYTHSNDFQFSDNLNFIHGKHNIKVGFEITKSQVSTLSSGNSAGAFISSGGVVTGNALADFMLGQVPMYVSNALGGDLRQSYIGTYVQDDFKVTRNLVLNLGVRYQVSSPYKSLKTATLLDGTHIAPYSTFNPGQQSQVFVNAPKGLVYPGDTGIPDSIVHADTNDIDPRFGLAWDIFGTGKTSLRAGYGIFHATPNGDGSTLVLYSPPFFVNFYVPQTPSMTNPIPANLVSAFPVPTAKNMDFSPYEPLTIQGMQPDVVNPIVHQFNVSAQQELPGKVSLQMAWVGNLTRNLISYTQENGAVFIPGNDSNGNPLSTTANTNSRRILNIQNPPAVGKPFQYGQVAIGQSIAHSSYESLQTEARKEFSHGVNLLASYTWSRAIDEASVFLQNGLATDLPQNPKDLRSNRGLSSFDLRHRFVGSVVYDIPSITRVLGANADSVASKIVDNWELAGIVTLSSGSPFNVVSGADNSLTNYGQDRPNLIGNPHLSTSRPHPQLLQQYFYTAAFTPNTRGTFGNFGRNVLIGPGRENVDLTVNKNFPISDRLGRFQLRFEFYDLFNHANFGNPGGNLSAATTFGKITTATSSRLVQFGGKWSF